MLGGSPIINAVRAATMEHEADRFALEITRAITDPAALGFAKIQRG